MFWEDETMKLNHRAAACALASATLLMAGCGSSKKAAETAAPATTGAAATTAAPTTAAATTVAPTPAATTTAAPTTTAPKGPQTVQVGVDGTNDTYNAAYFHYFPDTVTVHPGDTVRYKSSFRGEPHSIAFGSDIQALIELYRSQPPDVQSGQTPPPQDALDKFNALQAKIPPMLPEGPGDANQNSVNPCFVASGDIPADPTTSCPVTKTPGPFDGSATFWNSGFLADGATFDLQLSKDIKPGKYLGFCTLHFTQMISEIDVVAADQAIPSPDAVLAEGRKQLEDLTSKLTKVAADGQAASTPGQVQAGLGLPDVPNVLVTEFAPKAQAVKAGESVTWTINGPHTISFNAPESARTIVTQDPQGGFHLVPEALAPAGYTPPEAPPSTGPEAPPPALDAGTWDGTGFLNSGLQFGGTFSVTFSTPGSYEYVCLIHPDMKGTVTVT
jgi:plastocyanin